MVPCLKYWPMENVFYGVQSCMNSVVYTLGQYLVIPMILEIWLYFPGIQALDLTKSQSFSGVHLFLRSTLILYCCNYGLDNQTDTMT